MALGPAVKVPGLVFCSGQVGMGEIKAATVSSRPFKLSKSEVIPLRSSRSAT